MKGKKGCESRHIDDGVLYQAFISVFNTMVENRDFFIKKWRERLASGNALARYKSKQLIEIFSGAERVTEFDIDLYFAMIEKMTVYDGGRLIVSLFDGTDVGCEV